MTRLHGIGPPTPVRLLAPSRCSAKHLLMPCGTPSVLPCGTRIPLGTSLPFLPMPLNHFMGRLPESSGCGSMQVTNGICCVRTALHARWVSMQDSSVVAPSTGDSRRSRPLVGQWWCRSTFQRRRIHRPHMPLMPCRSANLSTGLLPQPTSLNCYVLEFPLLLAP